MSHPAPSYLSSLVRADNLAALDQAAAAAAREILAPARLAQTAFLVWRDPALPCGITIDQESLRRGRFCHPVRFTDRMLEILNDPRPLQRVERGWNEILVDGRPDHIADRKSHLIVLPLRLDETIWGGWILELTPGKKPPAPALDSSLPDLGQTLGLIFGHVLNSHLAREQHDQIVRMHDAILKALTATSLEDLLARLLGLMLRQFNLERVMIATISAQTQVLRAELHTGFNPDFIPVSVPMDMRDNFYVRAAENGEVQILEAVCGALPPELPRADNDALPERALLIPLRAGARPLGLIYADQPRHDGRPHFRQVLDLLGRMAGAALQNLDLRTSAEHRAETDPLTGLHNRFFLDKILALEIPRVKRYNQPLSLLMIDLCDFKQTNDAYGHQFGDYILRETASLLEANVRQPDFVVRFGGDEFIVLMVNTARPQAELVRERIENAFIQRNKLQTDDKMMIRISVGLRSADSSSIEGLIYDADMAMYAQKALQKRHLLTEALLSGDLQRIEAADRVVGSLCNMLYKKAPYYPAHSRRVTHLALIVARAIGLAGEAIETLTLAALLHDVGKVSLPGEIIQKPGALTAAEKQAIRHHPALGEEFFNGIDHLEPLRPLIRGHHERFDGQTHGEFPGYPDGLSGERIPLGARILKLAESVDCMLHDRTYRKAIPLEQVVQVIKKESGKSFDPRLTRILLATQDWHTNLGSIQRIRELLEYSD